MMELRQKTRRSYCSCPTSSQGKKIVLTPEWRLRVRSCVQEHVSAAPRVASVNDYTAALQNNASITTQNLTRTCNSWFRSYDDSWHVGTGAISSSSSQVHDIMSPTKTATVLDASTTVTIARQGTDWSSPPPATSNRDSVDAKLVQHQSPHGMLGRFAEDSPVSIFARKNHHTCRTSSTWIAPVPCPSRMRFATACQSKAALASALWIH